MGWPGFPRCTAIGRDQVVSLSSSDEIARLIEMLAALRAPETGCPWNLKQTHDTLAPYAIEEAYELADAIARGVPAEICDELGDCLLQVAFHARLAEEAGAFTFADVVEAICAKMLRRHPHVFLQRVSAGDASGGVLSEARRPEDRGTGLPTAPANAGGGGVGASSWEAIKAEEREGRAGSLLAGVPAALPGLTRAVKLQRRAAAVGFDWNDAQLVVAKIREEIDEVEAELGGDAAALSDEIGDLLFAVGNLARHVGIDPEAAVRSANGKFERRFAYIERGLASRGSSPQEAGLAEMEALWREAKRVEQTAATTDGRGDEH